MTNNLYSLNKLNYATVRNINFYDVLKFKESLPPSGVSAIPCETAFESDISSCEGHWCPTQSTYEFQENVKWMLRNNKAKSKCAKMNLGYPTSMDIHVVWNIRNRDICLHCDDYVYFRKIYMHILTLLELPESEVNKKVKFMIHSEESIESLKTQYPNFTYSFDNAVSLTESICQILTGDIYISTGSSMVIAGAFASKNTPIIFEEERNNLHNENYKQRHIFSDQEAVWMFGGEFTTPFKEVQSRVQAILGYKLK